MSVCPSADCRFGLFEPFKEQIFSIICFNFISAGAYVSRKISAFFSRSSRQAVQTGAAASACPFRGEPKHEALKEDMIEPSTEQTFDNISHNSPARDVGAESNLKQRSTVS